MAFQWTSDIGVSSIAELEALARSSGVPFTVTSTYRPGDPGYHGKHNAVDMASTPDNMRRLAAYLYQYSTYELELIHSGGPGYYVKNGKRGYTYPAAIISQHRTHVHLASTRSAMRAASGGDRIILAGATGTTPNIGCLTRTITVLIGLSTLIGGSLCLVCR